MQALSDPPAPSSSLYMHGETWGVSFLILTMVLFLGPVFTLGGGAIYVNKVAVKAKERTMKRMAEELARRCGDAHMPLLLVLVVLVLVLLVVLVLVLLLLALAALLTESVALVSPLESPSRGFCAVVPSVAKHRHTGRRSQSAIVWGRRATRRGRTKAARRRLVTLLVIALPTCEPSILLLFSFSCSLL
eukprot:COSAG01_NODE_876_length_12963_cov_5.315454_10_plen_189_part_00